MLNVDPIYVSRSFIFDTGPESFGCEVIKLSDMMGREYPGYKISLLLGPDNSVELSMAVDVDDMEKTLKPLTVIHREITELLEQVTTFAKEHKKKTEESEIENIPEGEIN